MTTATAPMAPTPAPGPTNDDPEKQREELAMLEGHDADIPTEEEPVRVDEGPKAQERAVAREHSLSPANTDNEKIGDEEEGRRSPSDEHAEKVSEGPSDPLDPNVVDWDGPDDPYNPMNWGSGIKWGAVATISAITFIT